MRSAHICAICFEPRHQLATLCTRCKRLRDRLDTRARSRGFKTDKAARQRALAAAWDPAAKAFRCYYGGVVLNHDPASPWHVTFDHRTPGDESDIVVCSALINDMKSDLTEEEFRSVVAQLAERFANKRGTIETLKPSRWRRGMKVSE